MWVNKHRHSEYIQIWTTGKAYSDRHIVYNQCCYLFWLVIFSILFHLFRFWFVFLWSKGNSLFMIIHMILTLVFLLWSLWLDSLSTKRRQVRGQSRFCRTLSFEFLWRGVVGGAAAGEVNAPAGHLQWCLAGLKVCWVLDFSVVVVVGVYVREQLESLNRMLTATVWIKWCWKAYRCGRVCHDFITLFHPAVITVRLRARVYWEWLLDNKTRSQS